MTLHICIGFSSYLEKLSLLFMAAGRQAPRHQALALVYPKSKELQNHLCEYFIVVTHICHRVQSFARKSTFGQLTTSLNDSDIKNFQSDLVLWSTSIKEEVDLLLNKHHENEAHLSAKARALAARWSASTAHRYDVEKKSKWLNSCSTYDFQTTWKQMQKIGSTSLLARSSEYRQWKELHSSTSILFSGKIGAGKSVTMANVALIEGANGMFLWAALQLDAICWENSDFDVRAAIKSLPRDLETTYARILERSTVRDSHKYYVRILKFLAAAYEPLTTAQVREMASVTIGQDNYDPRRQINNITNLLAFCGSLVMTDEEEGTVRFVHHSAKSFCQGSLGNISIWQFTAEEAHNELGGTILTYLNYSIFETKLSRNVVPEIDAGKISTGIMRQTFHDSRSSLRLAGSFFKPKGRSRQIGHILAQNSKDTGIVVPDHPFLSYAKEFWLLHTRYKIEPSTQRLWFNLIDEVDLSHLRTHPFVAAAWTNVEVPQEPAAFAGLFWSVQNSHIPTFDHAINLGKHASSFTSQFRRIVALRRMFKSLSSLSSLSPSSGDNPPVSPRPIIEAHMILHLLPISVSLKTFEFTKWIESHIEPAKCSKIPTRNVSALSTYDNSSIELSPGSIESPGPYELDATMTQIAALGGFPVTLDVPRTFKLLPEYPIHDFVDSPTSMF
ncbi:hypothetical protein Landi51_05362 [Colletotrichum acutatum]